MMTAGVTTRPACSGPSVFLRCGNVSAEMGTVPGRQDKVVTLELMRLEKSTQRDGGPALDSSVSPSTNHTAVERLSLKRVPDHTGQLQFSVRGTKLPRSLSATHTGQGCPGCSRMTPLQTTCTGRAPLPHWEALWLAESKVRGRDLHMPSRAAWTQDPGGFTGDGESHLSPQVQDQSARWKF